MRSTEDRLFSTLSNSFAPRRAILGSRSVPAGLGNLGNGLGSHTLGSNHNLGALGSLVAVLALVVAAVQQ